MRCCVGRLLFWISAVGFLLSAVCCRLSAIGWVKWEGPAGCAGLCFDLLINLILRCRPKLLCQVYFLVGHGVRSFGLLTCDFAECFREIFFGQRLKSVFAGVKTSGSESTTEILDCIKRSPE